MKRLMQYMVTGANGASLLPVPPQSLCSAPVFTALMGGCWHGVTDSSVAKAVDSISEVARSMDMTGVTHPGEFGEALLTFQLMVRLCQLASGLCDTGQYGAGVGGGAGGGAGAGAATSAGVDSQQSGMEVSYVLTCNKGHPHDQSLDETASGSANIMNR